MRRKPFLTYLILCAIPLLLLAGLNYWNGMKSVDTAIGAVVQHDLNSFNRAVTELLDENQNSILKLATAPGARRLVTETHIDVSQILPESPYAILNTLPEPNNTFTSVTLFDDERKPVWTRSEPFGWIFSGDLGMPDSPPPPDQRVWAQQGTVSLEKPGNTPAKMEHSAPIHDERVTRIIGAVNGIIDLELVFANALRGLQTKSNQQSLAIVVDHGGRIIYHPDHSLKLRPVNEALPEFNAIASAMITNASSVDEFRGSSGASYLAAYAPLPRLNVAVAVARNRSESLPGAHARGITGLVLALLASLMAAFVLDRHVQKRSKGIERVAEDVSAIAKGELHRRIILQSSDDARGLADNINVVTERLRAQIAREEESRQFESFIRLSAMLTHDLKNAIEGLSLTVANMERHFDNPQFRSDALKGLTSATEKLKALVARLARPLTSLSGEHKRPTKIDLVPIIQRVVTMTAEPQRGKHSIVTRLPPSLYALADSARVEEVLDNLVLNALEAMSDGGTLTIEAGHTEDGLPTFSVGDTGRGMSKSFIETRLFRPFSTTKKTGIGLGLYTCREVIHAGGGTIKVDSVEGAGTTFRVVLPSIPNDRRN